MSLFPLPADWSRARATLAPIAERAIRLAENPLTLRDELLCETLAAYRLRHDELAPLLTWFSG